MPVEDDLERLKRLRKAAGADEREKSKDDGRVAPPVVGRRGGGEVKEKGMHGGRKRGREDGEAETGESKR